MQVLFWVVVAFDLSSSSYVFVSNETAKVILFTLYAFILLFETSVMLVALFKMRSMIGNWKQGSANTKRMISHSAAFILFVIGIILDEAMNFFFDMKYYFIDWLFAAVLGTISMFCLANLLWHLGTKDKIVDVVVESFVDFDA